MMMLKLIWYIHQFLEISLTCRNLEPMEFKSQYGTHNHQFLTMIMQSPKTKVDFKYLIAFLKFFKKLSAACLHFQNLWHRLYFYALLGSYIISLRIRKERKVLLSLLSTSLKSSLYFCRKLYFSRRRLRTWLGDSF